MTREPLNQRTYGEPPALSGLAQAAGGFIGTMHVPDHDWIRGGEEDSA